MATNPAGEIYDGIGRGYGAVRQADPRIAEQVLRALGDSATVLNVGAGAGSYEPVDGRTVVALEPSAVMRAQRPAGSAPCIDGVAGSLPFPDGSFDATLTAFSLHHWPDQRAGLDELRRVASRNVIITFDPRFHERYWLVRDYLPEVVHLAGSQPLLPEEIARQLGGGTLEPVLVPSDCTDAFFWAFWRRPEAYLDPAIQAASSGIAQLPAALVAERMGRLAADLDSGAWHERNADLLELDEIDAGYRLVIAQR